MNTLPPESANLPWFDTLRDKYLAGEASVFVVHGNIFDYLLVNDQLISVYDFLTQRAFKETKKQVYEVSLRGLRTLVGKNPRSDKDDAETVNGGASLPALLTQVERCLLKDNNSAVIFPYAQNLFPNAELTMLSTEEKYMLTVLHEWSLNPAITGKDNLVLLLTESVSALNPVLLANPKIASIKIPFPDYTARHGIITKVAQLPVEQVEKLASQTAGLRLIQIESIVAPAPVQGLPATAREELILRLLQGTPDAAVRAKKLAAITAGMSPADIQNLVDPTKSFNAEDPYQEMLAVLHNRKKEIIEKECAGLIEVLNINHGLEVVGGMAGVKDELMAIAKMFKEGDTKRAPMGLLAVGPMGSGKTFVIKSFLKEAGIPGVVLHNFRSKWVGSTESNLEQVLTTVKAMGPCALIIDESDRSFGSAEGGESDGGTSSRTIARLKEFMSDTENRGQVLFILMSNRPDKLDVDIKRPGRLDKKIPFFYPETDDEQASIVNAILSRMGELNAIDWALEPHPFAHVDKQYSNADLEAVSILASELAARKGEPINNALLAEALADFIPPRNSQMLRLMELLAVSEASRRTLLPERYQSISSEALQKEISQLKQELRG